MLDSWFDGCKDTLGAMEASNVGSWLGWDDGSLEGLDEGWLRGCVDGCDEGRPDELGLAPEEG